MPPVSGQAAPPAALLHLADRLHSAAIHLLRRLRLEDAAAGLTAPRLSALSVLVFRGPATLSGLAAAEQVRPPTMTRLVQGLERDGLVKRRADPADRRVSRIEATPRGKALLMAGRARRVQRLARDLARLSPAHRDLVGRATELLEEMLRSAG